MSRNNPEWIKAGSILTVVTLVIFIASGCNPQKTAEGPGSDYSGSESCIVCHERFYDLWADSYHGLAMQPVTAEFIKTEIGLTGDDIAVGESLFTVESGGDSLLFTETRADGSVASYTAIYAMGGKYIYYFLTQFSRGRLQVLPVAWDCRSGSWYNNPESGVRHFEDAEDSALDWDSQYFTFNTSCYNCHVSQLSNNFNSATLEYRTTWLETGINCETCHGPSAEHVRVSEEAGEGNIPPDLKIIVTGEFTPWQHNSSCGSCHAKSAPLEGFYQPGEDFFDYFDLVTLEDHDFYPDGRDLGENYTMTSWMMNSCAAESDLNCVSCHTSSGRYRFAGDNGNNACMPCHSDKVNNPQQHTFHRPDSQGSLCISCHMPKTTFARMDRSDHSHRPPMPLATIEFGSPNACNICHSDMSPEWAQAEIEKTHKRDYQSGTIEAGRLLREARNGNWENLEKITQYLSDGWFDEVWSTSFIRLLVGCGDDAKWPVIIEMTGHQSPLVRGAAARALAYNVTGESVERLMELATDTVRVVRIGAGYALSTISSSLSAVASKAPGVDAVEEYRRSLLAHPDSWSSYYNLGNYYSNSGDMQSALNAYRKSLTLNPEAVAPMVNAGYIRFLAGDPAGAEQLFAEALRIDPFSEAALLNMALLYGETGDMKRAEEYFRKVMEVNPRSAVAAANLAIIVS
ncbi:MAG: ammonia-forming cytochrome c nitrite reductase subunit c552, partial [Bacteroidales bacterium]|nr:ammonia-forming cytochrome c nitrite reductase subunit c552 [Bacteroidales bacterium]